MVLCLSDVVPTSDHLQNSSQWPEAYDLILITSMIFLFITFYIYYYTPARITRGHVSFVREALDFRRGRASSSDGLGTDGSIPGV